MSAVICGALAPLGADLARTLWESGASVLGVDGEEGHLPEGCEFRRAALDDAEALRAVLAETGPPHVLVNAAGHGADAAAGLATTLKSLEVFGAAMRDAGRGSIVNIGSVWASRAADSPRPAAHGAALAGVAALTRHYARLWGPHGVRVNTLSPGALAGDGDEEFARRYLDRVPIRRMAEPEDLAAPLVFLCSPSSSYVNGAELHVDGGFTA
jgi:NAD(P)-dependent dehydrogenase (short-subunit alcohol dehydrogenase family)